VEGEREENQDDGAGQIGGDAQAEKQLVSGNVIGRCCCVPVHEEFGGNVDEAQGADKTEEQIPESGDSAGVVGWGHVFSVVFGALV
jgi:hypothetical protein